MDDECCNNGTCACNINPVVEPERATPWVAPGEEYEVRDDLVRDWVEAGAKVERARVRQIIEGRVAAWSGPGSGGGNAPLSDRIAVKDVLRDLLAALDEGANDE